jgi:hypothetical protein
MTCIIISELLLKLIVHGAFHHQLTASIHPQNTAMQK